MLFDVVGVKNVLRGQEKVNTPHSFEAHGTLGWTNRFFIKFLIPWHIIAEVCSGESERDICPIWSFFTVDTGSRSNHAKVRIRAAKGVSSAVKNGAIEYDGGSSQCDV